MTIHLKWPGFNEKDSVIIELAAELFCHEKNTIDVHGELFTLKKEFHVTLIGSKLGLIIQEKIKHNQTINKLLEKIFEKIDWSYKLTGPVHILSRSEEDVVEKSVIMLIEMPGVTIFFEQLRSHGLIDFKTPVPPPHVTMYTQNCPLGIGVPSDEALNTLSRKTISVDSLNKLCK